MTTATQPTRSIAELFGVTEDTKVLAAAQQPKPRKEITVGQANKIIGELIKATTLTKAQATLDDGIALELTERVQRTLGLIYGDTPEGVLYVTPQGDTTEAKRYAVSRRDQIRIQAFRLRNALEAANAGAKAIFAEHRAKHQPRDPGVF